MDTETAVRSRERSRTTSGVSWIATSALASAVGVVVAFLFDHLGLALAGWLADREPVLYHNEVVFQAGGSELALAGGAALSLVAGIFFLTLYPGARRYDAARLTVLWVVLHCFRQGFMQLVMVPFSESSNLSRAFNSLDVPAGLDLVVAAGGLVGMVSVALASAPAFLAYAERVSQIETPTKRFQFTARLALIPAVVGPLITTPIFLPDDTGLIPSLPFLGLFAVATVVASLGTRNVRVEAQRVRTGWSWLPLIWLVGFALVFQFLLRRGVVIPPSLSDPFVESL